MISKDKTYRTRDGREVRIYATDGRNEFPIHGAIKLLDGWMSCCWDESGYRRSEKWEDICDLIEVKPRHKRTVWLNVYDTHIYGAYDRNHVDAHPYNDMRLACIKVDLDFEEGEGL